MEFEDVSVAVLTRVCISMFENCLSHDRTMQNQWAENRLADFKLWSDGVGALASGPASLDSRLSSRPADLALVTGSLVMLKDFLIRCDSLSETGDPIEESIDGVNATLRNLALLATAIRRTGRRNRVEKADKRFRPDDHAELTSLLKILCHIQKSAKEKASAEAKDVKFSTADRLHEIESTGLSNSQERLIQANLLRRNRFLQAQRHSEGLKASHRRSHLTAAGPKEGQEYPTEKNTAQLPEIQAANVEPQISSAPTELSASKTIASVPESTLNMKGTQKESSKAAVTTITTLTSAMRYPKPPRLRDSSDIFKCPCCCQSLHRDIATEKTQWKKHLSQDISPYTCLLKDCSKPLATYANQQDWEIHVKSDHPPRRLCPFCQDSSRVFLGMEEFVDHIQVQHSENVSDSLIMAIMNHAGVVTIGVTTCPLCPSTGPESDPSFIRHVLQCTHDFSMRSLPWATDKKEKFEPHGPFGLDSMKYETMSHWLADLVVELPVDGQQQYLNHVQGVPEDTKQSFFDENDYFDLRSDQDSLEAFERSSRSFSLQEAEMDDSVESEEESLPFPIPSYLRHTSYISNLKAIYRTEILPRFSDPDYPYSTGSEPEENRPDWINYIYHPPPSKWAYEYSENPHFLPIIREAEFSYTGFAFDPTGPEPASARANRAMPIECGVYYFEIRVEEKHTKGMVAIGFSSKKASLERLPGWEPESWAYHSDDGKSFFGESQGQGRSYGPTFGIGDIVGCGVHFSTGRAFFTKNGVFLGTAFENDQFRSLTLFPSIGIKRMPTFRAVANFGSEPFAFDIDNYVQSIAMVKIPKPGVVGGLDARDPRAEYEIGWICNQPDSFEAARKLLEMVHGPLGVNQGDHNSYALGTIGRRKVVIGLVNGETPNKIPNSLPSFAHIKLLFFVGTGGGIPNLSEEINVRLGDVVTNIRGKFKGFNLEKGEIKSYLCTASAPTSHPLVAAISNMKCQGQPGASVDGIVSEIIKALSEPMFSLEDYRGLVSRPRVADRLYRTDYAHVGSLTLLANNQSLIANPCLNCDESQQVFRPEREAAHPLVHYGTVAVIDREMEDGLGPRLRDSFAERGVSSLMSMEGFNHESSPLMICGISDYADSHKNDIWRPYAATAAALVARKIILAMPGEEPQSR